MKTITEAQELYLQIISKCFEIDGGRIASDLRAQKEIWRSAFLMRSPQIMPNVPPTSLCRRHDLSVLWSLPMNSLLLNELIIAPEIGHENSLQELTKTWKPTSSAWVSIQEGILAMGGNTAGALGFAESANPDKFLLRLCWN